LNILKLFNSSLSAKLSLSIALLFASVLALTAMMYAKVTIEEFGSYLINKEYNIEIEQQKNLELKRLIEVLDESFSNTDESQLVHVFTSLMKTLKVDPNEYLIVMFDQNDVLLESNTIFPNSTTISMIEGELIIANSDSALPQIVIEGHPLTLIYKQKHIIAKLAIIPLSESDFQSLSADFESNITSYIILMFSLTFVFGAFLIRYIVHRHIAPLKLLEKATIEIRQGEYPDKIIVSGKDEIARLTHQFNEAFSQLKQQELSKKQMISDIAHELRTPITNVSGKLSALEDGLLEPKKTTFSELLNEIESLGSLVNDLQDLTLAQSGMLKLYPELTDISAEVQTVINSFLHHGYNKETEILNQVPQDKVIYTDKLRFRQILSNLIGNAIKYTPESVIIEISYREVANRIGIQVIDNGPGISEQKLAFIFDRHFQAEVDIQDRNFGFGLGLSIVQQLVKIQGGEIEVDSQPGTTKFIIWFNV
jgi:signal transduction histidine kinase